MVLAHVGKKQEYFSILLWLYFVGLFLRIVFVRKAFNVIISEQNYFCSLPTTASVLPKDGTDM